MALSGRQVTIFGWLSFSETQAWSDIAHSPLLLSQVFLGCSHMYSVRHCLRLLSHTRTELSNCGRAHITHKAQHIYSLKFQVLVAQLCPTLCNPMGCSPSGSSVHGILQAGILECVVISFSRGSSGPRDCWVSCIAGRLYHLSYSPKCLQTSPHGPWVAQSPPNGNWDPTVTSVSICPLQD